MNLKKYGIVTMALCTLLAVNGCGDDKKSTTATAGTKSSVEFKTSIEDDMKRLISVAKYNNLNENEVKQLVKDLRACGLDTGKIIPQTDSSDDVYIRFDKDDYRYPAYRADGVAPGDSIEEPKNGLRKVAFVVKVNMEEQKDGTKKLTDLYYRGGASRFTGSSDPYMNAPLMQFGKLNLSANKLNLTKADAEKYIQAARDIIKKEAAKEKDTTITLGDAVVIKHFDRIEGGFKGDIHVGVKANIQKKLYAETKNDDTEYEVVFNENDITKAVKCTRDKKFVYVDAYCGRMGARTYVIPAEYDVIPNSDIIKVSATSNFGKRNTAENTIDNDVNTCWGDGTKDTAGVGESLTYEFKDSRTVSGLRIWPGNQFNSASFDRTARPLRISVQGNSGESLPYNLIKSGAGSQVIIFDKPMNTKSIKITIEKINDDLKYKHTCISEVQFF